MPNDLTDIREWNGSQNDAFEILCCQLAAAEIKGTEASFTTTGFVQDSGPCQKPRS